MDNDSKLKKLFIEKGRAESLKSFQAFSFHQGLIVYLDHSDALDLFAIHKGQEENKHFITNYEEGLLFSFPPLEEGSQYEIIANSVSASSVYILEIAQFEEHLQNDPELQGEVCRALETWIYKLSRGLVQDYEKKREVLISPESQAELGQDELLLCKNTVQQDKEFTAYWIQVLEGEISLMGNNEVKLNPQSNLFPICEEIWFYAHAAAKVEAFETQILFEKKIWRAALDQFSHCYLIQLITALQKQQEIQKELLETRASEEKRILSKAYSRVRSLFARSDDLGFNTEENPLLQALQVLAKFQKIKFSIPRELDKQPDLEEKLEAICLTSKIRRRKVKLSENWWKINSGPFLGFLKNENKPIALLNGIGSKYYKIDEHGKQLVSKKLAEEISDTAYMFYIPLDESITTAGGMVTFFLKRIYRHLVAIFTYALLAGFIVLLFPMATKFIFNTAIPKNDPALVQHIAYSLICVSVAYAFFFFLRSLTTVRMETIGFHLVECGLWDRLLKLSPSFFRKHTTGNLFQRLISAEKVRLLLTGNVVSIIVSALFSFIFVFMMFFYSPTLALIALAFSLFNLFITYVLCRFKIKYLTRAFETGGVLEGFTLQLISAMAKLRVAGAEKSVFATWSEQFSEFEIYGVKARLVQAAAFACTAVLPILSTMCIYAAFIVGIGINNLPLPDFLAFTIAYSSFTVYFYPVNQTLIQLVDVIPHWQRMKPIMEEPIEEKKDKLLVTRVRGSISFEEVVFGYDSKDDPIIDKISFKVNPHEFVAFVGPSGAGKSTLVRLLLGFEQPQSGSIYIDKKDLASLDLRSFRKRIGTVSQQEGIMAGSIYTNLVCGGRHSIEQVQKALQLSDFEKDVKEMPMGLNTFVPMNGETLSGGQKQRLLLSRALVGEPAVLIFDEATSALDNVTQNKVTENIEKLNVTRIVIAQRLSTIRKADTIYVIEKGKIVQKGTFKELESTPGLFAEMVKRQRL